MVAINWRSSARGVPTTKLMAESAHHPSTEAPQSTFSRSPSASRMSLGSPCSTASLTDVQMTPLNGLVAKPG